MKDPRDEFIPSRPLMTSPFDLNLGFSARPDLSALLLGWPVPAVPPSDGTPGEYGLSQQRSAGASNGILGQLAEPLDVPSPNPWPGAQAPTPWTPSMLPTPSGPLAFGSAARMPYPFLPDYRGTISEPSSASARLPADNFSPVPRSQHWDPTRATASSNAQILSEPPAASTFNAPAPSTNAAPSWPVYEFDLVQDALRAGAEKIGRRGRQAPIPYPTPLPPSPEHVEATRYWGAGPGPSAGSDQPFVNGAYLSPVGKAPSWEQVVLTATPWSVSPKLPSPTSWGEVSSGVECHSSGGNLHCITPGRKARHGAC